MSVCPNCSTQLGDPVPLECPKCHADFGPGSAWLPAGRNPEESDASQPQTDDWASVKLVFSLLIGTIAFIAASQGPRTGTDKTSSLVAIVLLTAVAVAMRKLPWWLWLLYLPVLLVGGCTALFLCCFKWQGG